MQYELENVSIRMVKEPPLLCDKPVNSPGRAVEVLYDLLHDMDRELLIVVNLKADVTPINMNIASVGTVNAPLSSPRELLKSAVLSNAAATMIFHNHPSGNLTPSQADINLTDKMLKAFVMLDIPNIPPALRLYSIINAVRWQDAEAIVHRIGIKNSEEESSRNRGIHI